jgi:conjugal transfer mating pair stabilization protein TraN
MAGRTGAGAAFVIVMGLLPPAGVVYGQANCSGITDPLQKAQCATGNMRATGALDRSAVSSQQGAVPQYNGTAGCTSADCAGASQSGYYSNTGDVGALNVAGATAAVTDPKAATLTDMQTQKNGWNMLNTSPVQSAQSVQNNWTATNQTGQNCITTDVCIEYVAAPTTPVQCTMPGTTRVQCFQNYSPTLTAAACGSPPNSTPPVDTETFLDGCAPWGNVIAANQAVLVSQLCTDSSARLMACPDYNGVNFLMPTYQAFSVDKAALGQGKGMYYGYYNFNYGIPTPNGIGGYTLGFSVSGNSTGENKYGCTNGTYGGGTFIITEGQTISYGGSPPYCNSKCSCWGAGLTFKLGTATWVGNSFTVPFSYSFGGFASGTINIQGGLTRSSYTVSPNTGCWQTEFEYDITTQIPDSCQQYRDAQCTQTGSQCTQTDPLSGSCQIYTNTFQCNGGNVCSKTQQVQQCSSCGQPGSYVPFCMDTSSPPNQNFQITATMMAMVQAVQNDFDKDNLRIFTGTPKMCSYSTLGTVFIDCCADDPSKMFGSCSDEEISLANDKKAKEVIYIGTKCIEWWSLGLGSICARKGDVYCTYKSELGRIIQQQGRPQLGLNFGTVDLPDCEGFTLNQFSALNFAAMDFTEYFATITTNFDQNAVATNLKQKACALNPGAPSCP